MITSIFITYSYNMKMELVNEGTDIYFSRKNLTSSVVSKSGCCKVLAVCINCELLAEILNAEKAKERVPLIRLQWQGSVVFQEKATYITVSLIKEDGKSTMVVNLDLLNDVAQDTLALQEFASKMYRAYNVRLTTLEYPPLVLTFHHCSGQHGCGLVNDKKKLLSLLKRFLLKEEKMTSKLKYQINVQTGELKNTYNSCHCFHLDSGESDMKIIEMLNRSEVLPDNYVLPLRVEERFQSIEKELSDQRQFIDYQFDEQKRQYDDIDASLNIIAECLRKRKADVTQDNRMQNKPDQLAFPVLTSDYTVWDSGETDELQVPKDDGLSPKCHTERMSTEKVKYVTQDEERQTDEGRTEGTPQTRRISEIETHGDKKKPDLLQDVRLPRCQEERCMSLPKPEKESSSYLQGHAHSGLGTGMFVCDSGSVREDDLYREGQGQASSYHGYSYSSSASKSQYRSQKKGTYGASSGFKMKLLVVTSDGNYSPQSTGQYYTSKGYTAVLGDTDYTSPYPSSDSGYYTSAGYEYSDMQSSELNFDLEQANQLYPQIASSSEQMKKEKLWDSREGKHKLRLRIECMIGDSPNWKRLSESVAEAMLEDATQIPRVDQALDTVICLDTSGSMAGEVLEKLKRIVLEFLDGVENIARKYNIEENIALVTFGGRGKVLHHLSNDYGRLRKALDKITPGGPSPILEGLLVSMACLTKGGLYPIDKKLKLPPRLIIITDGYVTGERPENTPDCLWVNDQGKDTITKAFAELHNRQIDDGVPFPVIFVPLGTPAMMVPIEALALTCEGVIASAASFPNLCKYQHFQHFSVEALRCIISTELDSSMFQTTFYKFMSKLGADLSETETKNVFKMVKKNMFKMSPYYGSKYSFYNIREEPDLPPLGSRVMRGPDWKWGNQDTEVPGTIINHSQSKIVWVCWDNGHINVYRYGQNGKYDIVTVEDQPRMAEGCAPEIGVQVHRGPDWHQLYEDQDGGRGQYGVIIRMDALGKVLVRWQNGQIYDYNCDAYQLDVVVRDPIASILETTAIEEQEPSMATETGKTYQDTDKPYEWQRKDDINGWETYSDEINAKLKNAYFKNPHGSCLILRNQKSYRVSFRALEERAIEGKKAMPVRQHFLETIDRAQPNDDDDDEDDDDSKIHSWTKENTRKTD